MTFSIKHADPNERDYSSYAHHLFAYNKAIQRKIGNQIEEIFRGIGQGHAVVTVGSDARLEKGPVSPVELVLLNKTLRDKEGVVKRVEAYVAEHQDLAIFDPSIETKEIGSCRMFETVLNGGSPEEIRLISPNRMLDAWFLAGDRETYHEMQKQLVEEIKSDDPGKTIRNRIQSKVGEHKKVTKTGMQRYKGQDIVHFDLQGGITYYDPEKKLSSFKQGPLRLVQYAVVRDQIKGLREGCDPAMVFTTSRNTVARLNDLEVYDSIKIDHTTITEIADHYAYFLWMYHRSQAAYKDSKRVAIGFDGSEATRRVTALERICSEPIFQLKNV